MVFFGPTCWTPWRSQYEKRDRLEGLAYPSWLQCCPGLVSLSYRGWRVLVACEPCHSGGSAHTFSGRSRWRVSINRLQDAQSHQQYPLGRIEKPSPRTEGMSILGCVFPLSQTPTPVAAPKVRRPLQRCWVSPNCVRQRSVSRRTFSKDNLPTRRPAELKLLITMSGCSYDL